MMIPNGAEGRLCAAPVVLAALIPPVADPEDDMVALSGRSALG